MTNLSISSPTPARSRPRLIHQTLITGYGDRRIIALESVRSRPRKLVYHRPPDHEYIPIQFRSHSRHRFSGLSPGQPDVGFDTGVGFQLLDLSCQKGRQMGTPQVSQTKVGGIDLNKRRLR